MQLPRAGVAHGVAVGERPAAARFVALALVFTSVVINYMDRANLALVAPALDRELHLGPVRLGLVFSAFGWAYVAAQLPGGWVVDRVRARILYAVLLAGWSVATALQATVRGFGGLVGLRLAVGGLEAPSFPINNKVVTAWFPQRERARAISTYISGQFVGMAFLTPALAYLQAEHGWRAVFIATGALGLGFSAVWWAWYREPAGPTPAKAPRAEARPFAWRDVAVVLRSRSLWGVFIGHTCVSATLWFFLTWFPTYLVEFRHMGFIKMGVWTSVPFIAAFLGVLTSGWISDGLLARGCALATARKAPLLAGLVCSMGIIGANYAHQDGWVMAFFTVAFFGNGLASIGWTFVSALAPRPLIGLVGGMYNFIGNSSAIFVPIVVGYLVRHGAFAPALVFISGCAVVGFLAYGLVVREVAPIEL